MTRYLKVLNLSLIIVLVTFFSACEKNNELKKQVAELQTRVSEIENQITKMNRDLVMLEQLDKLTSDEINSLKVLTAGLSTLTDDIKNNVSLNANEIEKLKSAITNAATFVQFEDLKKTIIQLGNVVNSNHVEQLETDETTKKLTALITQMAGDLERLKSIEQVIRLDRPINLSATKGSYGNRIVISWTPIPLAKNYQLFRFDSESEQYEMVNEGSDTTFTDLNSFDPFKKVFYKVRVVNSSKAYSEFSDVNFGYTSGLRYSLYFQFGYEGTEPGLFSFPMHVATDAYDNIYVSDEQNNRVQKFDPSGKFKEIFYYGSGARAIAFLKNGNAIATRTQSSSYIQILDPQKAIVKEWGTQGTGTSQFGNIEEITLDNEENLYVVDAINNRVQKFDRNGKFLLEFVAATRLEGQTERAYPFGICYMNNKLFVTSTRNGLVSVFDTNGNLLKAWDTESQPYAIKAHKGRLYIACDTHILKTDENGDVKEKIGAGQFPGVAVGLAVNSKDEIIVSEVYSRFVKVFKTL